MTISRALKVLQVVHGLGMGGAETWLMELLRLWSKSGAVEMDFLLTSGQRGLFDDEATKLGAKIHYLRYGRDNFPAFWRGFRRLLRQGRYDAIHDHADYASGWHFALAIGLLPKVRVTHVHNPWLHIDTQYATNSTRRWLASGGKVLVRSLATHVCGTSAEILHRYGFEPTNTSRSQVGVLHCGFDVGRFNGPRDADRRRVLKAFGWPSQTKLVLYVGRLDWALEFPHPQNHKNTWLALNIAREAVRREPDIRLIMVGTGASREALLERVQKWSMAEQLRLPGIRRDIPALMRASDVLLFPSAQEGLGMVAVEAQAAGLPVLASTNVPKEARVVPQLYHSMSLDEPAEEWARRLIEILSEPLPTLDRCRSMLERSEFSIEKSAQALETIYASRKGGAL